MTESLEQIQNEIKSLDDRRLELETKARRIREQQKAEESAAREKKNEDTRNKHYARIDVMIEEANRYMKEQKLNLSLSRVNNRVSLSIVGNKYAAPLYEYKLGKVEDVLDWIQYISNYAEVIDELLFRYDEFVKIEVANRTSGKVFFIRGYFKDRTAIDTAVYFTVTFEECKVPEVYIGTDLVRESSCTRIPIGNGLYLSTEVEEYEDHFFVTLDAKKYCTCSEIIPFLTEARNSILTEVESRKDEIKNYSL